MPILEFFLGVRVNFWYIIKWPWPVVWVGYIVLFRELV